MFAGVCILELCTFTKSCDKEDNTTALKHRLWQRFRPKHHYCHVCSNYYEALILEVVLTCVSERRWN